jgi:hypothetical protein
LPLPPEKNGDIKVYVLPFRLHPRLASKLKEKENRGWWALPCSKIRKSEPEGRLLDPKSVEWIAAMVKRRITKGHDNLDGTLKQLISDFG